MRVVIIVIRHTNSREKLSNLFNQLHVAYVYRTISRHCLLMPSEADTDTHTDAQTKAILRNQVRMAEGCAPGLKRL